MFHRSSHLLTMSQYPDGPVIAVQSENEFFPSSPGDPGRSESMVEIENTLRANGVTKVPLTHNDASPSGRFAHGLGEVDLYMWDSYPQGFDCANPTSWPEINSASLDIAHKVHTATAILRHAWSLTQLFARLSFQMSCGQLASSREALSILGVAYARLCTLLDSRLMLCVLDSPAMTSVSSSRMSSSPM